MSRYRLYPSPDEYIYQKRRPVRPLPGYAEQARMLTQARAEYAWLAAGALSTGEKLHCPGMSSRERVRLRKAERRKDWCEKISTGLARRFDVIRFEDLRIKNMTNSARGTAGNPGSRVRAKSGFTCNADINASINIAARQAGGTPASVREPQLLAS